MIGFLLAAVIIAILFFTVLLNARESSRVKLIQKDPVIVDGQITGITICWNRNFSIEKPIDQVAVWPGRNYFYNFYYTFVAEGNIYSHKLRINTPSIETSSPMTDTDVKIIYQKGVPSNSYIEKFVAVGRRGNNNMIIISIVLLIASIPAIYAVFLVK